ncbi:hypothetical protein ACIRON_00270 [Nocardioides sp. NPDC101246]|uniref:hypothetical protein n=1 Tax=Nocardioides sp. NPDC101246 TaxID=3364336 RepID=UPI003825C376
MTEANRRPATGDLSNVPHTPARHPATPMLPTNGTAPDPLEIAHRALEGMTPSDESWFTNPKTNPAAQRVQPRHTPYAPPQPGTALVLRHPDAGHSQRPQATYQRPAPHTQPPQYAYQPSPYTAQQFHPAGPVMFANPAMPSYAAAQVPTRNGVVEEHRIPKGRARNKKTVLLPLAAMAIASAGIGAFAQANVDPDVETQQVEAHAGHYDAVPVVDIADQKVIDAPGVIAPEKTSPFSPAAPNTSGGKHSNGDYDAPSTAEAYGGAHSSSGTVSTPLEGDTLSDRDPAPAPEPAPEPTPEPTPQPEPEPEPTPVPTQPSLGKNVVAPVLDTVTGVIDGLTGIQIDLTP